MPLPTALGRLKIDAITRWITPVDLVWLPRAREPRAAIAGWRTAWLAQRAMRLSTQSFTTARHTGVIGRTRAIAAEKQPPRPSARASRAVPAGARRSGRAATRATAQRLGSWVAVGSGPVAGSCSCSPRNPPRREGTGPSRCHRRHSRSSRPRPESPPSRARRRPASRCTDSSPARAGTARATRRAGWSGRRATWLPVSMLSERSPRQPSDVGALSAKVRGLSAEQYGSRSCRVQDREA